MCMYPRENWRGRERKEEEEEEESESKAGCSDSKIRPCLWGLRGDQRTD